MMGWLHFFDNSCTVFEMAGLELEVRISTFHLLKLTI